MKKQFVIAIIIFVIAGAAGYLIWRNNIPANDTSSQNVGGNRDKRGCLTPAGYAFDDEVGACIRAFEMTSDIKRAARLAVENVGASYALTVASFNSYEKVGSYDITLERGLEREKVTVYIKDWKIVPEAQFSQTTEQAIQNILAKKYNKPISEVRIAITKEAQGFAAGSVLFGKGGPGEGGMWLAVLGNGWSVVWDGNGNVNCDKMRQEYGFPDTILAPNFCQPQEATAEEAVRAYAAAKSGVNKDSVTVVSSSQKDWSDSCLGLGGAAESCLAAITPGYEITVKVNGARQTYRTNADGSEIRK